MDKERIKTLKDEMDSAVAYARSLSDDIIESRTKDLDELMARIQEDVVIADNPSNNVIEQYFLELTNALYFINSRCEYFGFYEDISKSNARLAYNNAYADNQVKNAAAGVKTTVADNQMIAENMSLDETLLNLIYSRAFRIIKSKIDSANEMVRTLSKILSAHMQEQQLSSYGSSYVNKGGFSD